MDTREPAQQKQTLSQAFQKGVDIGKDINQARADQRLIVAQRIKALRTEKGISQEKFSDMIHANTLTYRGYENCKSDIPLFYLVRIADLLETSLDYLAGRTELSDPAANLTLEERVKKLEKIVLQEDSSK